MWDEVGQALSHSMTKMLSQFASLLPGILALMTALVVSAADRLGFCGDSAAVADRFRFRPQSCAMGLPGAGEVVAVLQSDACW